MSSQNSRRFRFTTAVMTLAFALALIAIGAANSALASVPQSGSVTGTSRSGALPKVTGPAAKAQQNKGASPYLILYSQFDNPGTNSTLSQNFETALDAYDSQLADDFIVAGASWTVNEVDVAGLYFNGNP